MCRRQPARYPRAVSVPVALALAVAVTAPASAAPVREASSTPAPGFAEPVPKASPGGPAFTTAPAPVPGRARLRGQVLVYGSRDVVFGARILGATRTPRPPPTPRAASSCGCPPASTRW
jgi:hypothetical protein